MRYFQWKEKMHKSDKLVQQIVDRANEISKQKDWGYVFSGYTSVAERHNGQDYIVFDLPIPEVGEDATIPGGIFINNSISDYETVDSSSWHICDYQPDEESVSENDALNFATLADVASILRDATDYVAEHNIGTPGFE